MEIHESLADERPTEARDGHATALGGALLRLAVLAGARFTNE